MLGAQSLTCSGIVACTAAAAAVAVAAAAAAVGDVAAVVAVAAAVDAVAAAAVDAAVDAAGAVGGTPGRWAVRRAAAAVLLTPCTVHSRAAAAADRGSRGPGIHLPDTGYTRTSVGRVGRVGRNAQQRHRRAPTVNGQTGAKRCRKETLSCLVDASGD